MNNTKQMSKNKKQDAFIHVEGKHYNLEAFDGSCNKNKWVHKNRNWKNRNETVLVEL